jgi:predicted ester cyclase
MTVIEVMERYLAALAAHDVDQVETLTTDDLRFVTEEGDLRRSAYLETLRALFAAFPDWRFDHGRLRVGWDHASVELRMEGTHTGTLVLPVPGVEPIPATGRAVVLPAQDYTFLISQGCIVRIEPMRVVGGGIPGLLDQIGSDLPLPPA